MEISPEEFVAIMNRLDKAERLAVENSAGLKAHAHLLDRRADDSIDHRERLQVLENDKRRESQIVQSIKELEDQQDRNNRSLLDQKKVIDSIGAKADRSIERLDYLSRRDKEGDRVLQQHTEQIKHLEPFGIAPTEHGKYQKLVEACASHLKIGGASINHRDIKAALEELDA